jgi:amino acid adenylation domain-containing protein
MSEVKADRQEKRGVPRTPQDSLPGAFERATDMHRLHPAIGSGVWRPTYGELNETANRLAHALLRRGGAAGDRVAILMQHDAPMIAAVLGALKAGRTVVVLNPTDPGARLSELVHDAQTALIVSDGEHRRLATAISGEGCAVEPYESISTSGPACNPGIRVSPDDVAFLCYTSGSTARPKAVMRTHGQEVRNARVHAGAWELVAHDRVALLASLTGGLGSSISWCALLHGAALYPFGTMDRGFVGLADALTDHGITILPSTASFFRAFVKSLGDGTSFPQIRVVRLGSESATSEDFSAFQAHFPETSRFVLTFGSSEAGNIAQLHLRRGDKVAEGRLPIGRPADEIEVELLDERGAEVAPGETGEIVVRGHALCAGYWRNPAATTAQFSEAPAGSGIRVFYSGDLARVNPDGLLEFVGRKDTGVKIRGYRVDLREVEQALVRLPVVERVYLDAVEGLNDELQLVAYVVPRQPSSAGILRRALRAVLPRHMVPTAFVFLDGFPLTPHGKVDRDKLRQVHALGRVRLSPEQPTTDTELLLARIWSDVFDLPEIYRHDDFFDLGGDSLAAATVAVHVHSALGITLDLGAFHDHPTLAGLAAIVEQMRGVKIPDDAPQLAPVPRRDGLPLSFIQERVWNYSQSARAAPGYTSIRSYHVVGPLDHSVLRACMSHMAARHETLRSTFPAIDGRAVQVVHPPAPVPLPFLDLAGAPEPERQARLHMEREAARGFDLAEGPLLRFSLIRLRENEHWLLRACHHIVSDAWSSEIYFRQLGHLYETKRSGGDLPLPETASLQYGDYAVWERKTLSRDGATYGDAISWWADALAEAPRVVELPFRRAQPVADADPADGEITWGIDGETSLRLAELARAERTTYYVVRLATFVMLLAAETGKADIVLGTYVTNRNRPELHDMLGFFSNLATLRFTCERSMKFRDWLSVVRTRLVETEAHCQIPYEELRRELLQRGVVPPDIQVIINVARHQVSFHFSDIKLTMLELRTGGMPWGLTMMFDEHREDHRCQALFDAGIYQPAGMHRMVDRLRLLLNAVSHHPDSSVDALLAMSAQGVQDH